jgi:shikimate kinase
VRKVALVTSASGSGATTVGRHLAARLGVPFHELDALLEAGLGRVDG